MSWFLAPDNWRRKRSPENGQCVINFSNSASCRPSDTRHWLCWIFVSTFVGGTWVCYFTVHCQVAPGFLNAYVNSVGEDFSRWSQFVQKICLKCIELLLFREAACAQTILLCPLHKRPAIRLFWYNHLELLIRACFHIHCEIIGYAYEQMGHEVCICTFYGCCFSFDFCVVVAATRQRVWRRARSAGARQSDQPKERRPSLVRRRCCKYCILYSIHTVFNSSCSDMI